MRKDQPRELILSNSNIMAGLLDQRYLRNNQSGSRIQIHRDSAATAQLSESAIISP